MMCKAEEKIEKKETKQRADKLLNEAVAEKRNKILDSIDRLAFEVHVMTSKKMKTNEAKL